MVTFSYENVANGTVPVHIKIEKIRTDINWHSVLSQEELSPQPISGIYKSFMYVITYYIGSKDIGNKQVTVDHQKS